VADVRAARHRSHPPGSTPRKRPGRAHRFRARERAVLSLLRPKGSAILKAASTDPDAALVIEATYITARRAAIRELVDRLENSHELGPTWSPERAVAALMIITSLEAFETLTGHNHLGIDEAAEVLGHMASVLLRGT
jgi:hypothetical protein